jgi:hypothetical protein
MAEIAPEGRIYRRREFIRYPASGWPAFSNPPEYIHRVESSTPINGAIACRLVKVCGKPFFANIHEGNNVVDWFSNTDTAVHSFTVTPGYYVMDQLLNTLNAGMTAAGGGETWASLYDSATDVFKFATAGGGPGNQFNLLFGTGVNVGQSIAGVLGFPGSDTGLVNAINSTLGTSLDLPCVILMSNALGAGRKHNTSDTDGSHQDVCWSVPLQSESPAPIVSYEPKSYDSDRIGYQGNRTIGPEIDISFLPGPAYHQQGVTAERIGNLGSLLIEVEFDILDVYKP